MDQVIFATIETMFKSLVGVTRSIPSLADEASAMAIQLRSIRELIILDLREAEVDTRALGADAPCVQEFEEFVETYQALMKQAIAITVRRIRDIDDD